MDSKENQVNLIAMAIGAVLVAAALHLVVTRRAWIGRHLPLSSHPSSPRPGTVPRMARGLPPPIR